MADGGDQDVGAFKWTAITFAICLGIVLLTLLIEYLLGDKSNQRKPSRKSSFSSFVTYFAKGKLPIAYFFRLMIDFFSFILIIQNGKNTNDLPKVVF